MTNNEQSVQSNEAFLRAVLKTVHSRRYTSIYTEATAKANAELDPWKGGYTFFLL